MFQLVRKPYFLVLVVRFGFGLVVFKATLRGQMLHPFLVVRTPIPGEVIDLFGFRFISCWSNEFPLVFFFILAFAFTFGSPFRLCLEIFLRFLVIVFLVGQL